MNPGLGVVARLLVRNGTLRTGDVLLAGQGYGRVRRMTDSHGQEIDQAPPSTPVEVSGLDAMPEAGDKFYVVEELDEARSVSEDRRQRARDASLATVPKHTLEDILGRIEAGKADVISLIIKADVQGSIEAIVGSLNKLSTAEVRVNVLHTAVGGITTGDVQLAEASDAIIIGFNAVPDASSRQLAERIGVDIRQYRIIYDIIDDIRKVLEEGLRPRCGCKCWATPRSARCSGFREWAPSPAAMSPTAWSTATRSCGSRGTTSWSRTSGASRASSGSRTTPARSAPEWSAASKSPATTTSRKAMCWSSTRRWKWRGSFRRQVRSSQLVNQSTS